MLVSEHVLTTRDFTFDRYFTLPLEERQWQFVRLGRRVAATVGVEHSSAGHRRESDARVGPSRAAVPRGGPPSRGPGVARLRREAEAEVEAGRPREAIAMIDARLQTYPRALNLYMTRGVARHQIGDHDGEMLDFETAIALNPLITEAHYNRALARDERGDVTGARRDYEEYLRRSPQSAPGRAAVAERLTRLGQ